MTPGRDPDFVIVGAQRCGTTSLLAALRDDPGAGSIPTDELHFFDFQYELGLDWYRSHFSGPGLVGESSPYYLFHPLAPRRFGSDLVETLAICVLRDPIERAFSQWQWNRRRGREPLDFLEALDAEPARLVGEHERMLTGDTGRGKPHQDWSYVARGDYRPQVECWREACGHDRVLVVDAHALFVGDRVAQARVLGFLDLDTAGLPPRHLNASTDTLPDDLRARAAGRFTYDPSGFRDLCSAE
ncbi:MAG: sulfotransferase domain-containing protein [Actinomycetia bacterium]|nr:sulfotransferase domain-containing protein [Actinomycetes bacterium]